MSIKLPYGISYFNKLVCENYYYLDRTAYIEKLEQASEPYVFFLRPRRFGKSLFVSTLWHYYGLEFTEQFSQLFANYYIGQHPTPKANSYAVLYFEFSRIDTSSKETTFKDFLTNVRLGVEDFLDRYTQFERINQQHILSLSSPNEILKTLFNAVRKSKQPIYIMIDEYDHFANEILAFNFEHFSEFVSRNGFVRKFYEAIKEATGRGIVDRFFATGVTPITLDSLTSGFNIGANFSTHYYFHDMMGFTEGEVEILLQQTAPNLERQEHQRVLENLKKWYNGYIFARKAKIKLYNPDMVLYFLKEYAYENEYPESLIDVNIASDYSKISRLFSLGKAEHYQFILEELIETGKIEGLLSQQFSFEKEFSQDDFISLLFYLGLLTLREAEIGQLNFSFPNYVIKKLYWEFFLESIKQQYQLDFKSVDVRKKITRLAQENEVKPFIGLIEKALQTLSNRDFVSFDEKYIKALFVGFASLSNLYFIKSEPEVEQKYPDIMFLYRPPFMPNYQFLFELKYLKKTQMNKLKSVQKNAVTQVKNYLTFSEIKGLANLKSWLIVFVGDKAEKVEEILETS